MKRLNATAVTAVMGLASLFAFQNCGKFSTEESSSVSSSSVADVHMAPQIMRMSATETPNVDLVFQIYDKSLSASAALQWSYSLDGSQRGCTAKTATNASSFTLNCTNPGSLIVSVRVTDQGIVRQLNYSTALANLSTSGGEIPVELTFEIPAGTSMASWNTMANQMEVFVGQKLKIKNMDSIAHQLHTNGAPCGHGGSIAPGATADCVVSKSYSKAANGKVYDHIAGQSAEFQLVAYDGAALYASTCAGCHGPLATSTKLNKKVSQILAARSSQPAMQTSGLMSLSRRQIEAISYALGGR